MNEKFEAFWTEHKPKVIAAAIAVGTYILGVGVGAKLMAKHGKPTVINVAVVPPIKNENLNP